MPLPLREYYPIERAADLLECTVDDLIHWAMIGGIRVYLNIECAYGDVLINLDDYAHPENIDLITNGTKYKQKIVELDEENIKHKKQKTNLRYRNEYDNYLIERLNIIYLAMIEYKNKNNNKECFNELGMKDIFYYLTYWNKGFLCEDFCNIYGLDVSGDEENIFDIFKNPSKYAREYFKDIRTIARISGFVGLGMNFFTSNRMRFYFASLDACTLSNSVYFPDSNFCINIVTDKDFSFNVNELFILKSDFIAIQNASIGKGEIKRRYHKCGTNNQHKINKNIKPHITEMHAAKRESVLKAAMYMKKNHPDLCKTYSSWAGAIIDHAHKFWDNGECLLTQKVIAEMLSKAENHTLI